MRYFAAGLPQVSTRLGDRRGPLIGIIASSVRRPVMFDSHYSTEVKKASGLVPIVGRQGAGKSVLEAAICYQAARRGIRTVMLDPSGPLAALCEMPELREFAEHIDLAKAPPGTLSPWAVVPEPQPGHFDIAGAVRRGGRRGPRRAQDAVHRHRPDAAAGADRPQPAHRAAAAAGDPRGRLGAGPQLLGGDLAAAGVRRAALRRLAGRRVGDQAAAGRGRRDARADARRPALRHRGDPAGPAVLPAADPARAGAGRAAAAHRGGAHRHHDERAGAAEPERCRASTGRSPSG